jgi:5-formyltetrahydrofolate cyclo-ligase family
MLGAKPRWNGCAYEPIIRNLALGRAGIVDRPPRAERVTREISFARGDSWLARKRTATDGRRDMDRAEVVQWRKAERQRLIGERLAMNGDVRRRRGDQIAASLEKVIGDVRGLIVSAYWPFRGEPDLRGFMAAVSARGGRCALPVVVERGKPLVFRLWSPGEPLARGVWNIPVPVASEEVVPT